MDLKNMGALVGGLVVSVILLAAVLVPVISEATETEKTFTNSGGYYPMTEITSEDTETYTIEWDGSDRGKLTINGVEFDANGTYGTAATSIMAAEDWLIRYWSSGTDAEYIQFFNGTNWFGTSTDKSFSLSASEGTATISLTNASNVQSTRTATYTTLYVIDTSVAEDVMKKATDTPYILGETEIYAMGITNISGDLHLVKITGTIDDGVTVSVLGVDGETINNLVIDSTAVNGYKDLYTINKITFTVDYDGQTTDCTYSVFIVPYEVTAELSSHPDSTVISLLNLMPLLVTVGIIIGIVGMAFSRRE